MLRRRYSENTQTVAVFVLIALALSPMIFFGFHPHHEGLMLSTLRLTRDTIINGGQLPFNQYGPVWTLPYLMFSLAFPDGLFFFSTRLLSWMIFLVCLYLIYRVSRKYSSHTISLSLVLLFSAIYPMPRASVPWPSIPAMLFLTLTLYICCHQKSDSLFKVFRNMGVVGFLLACTLGTRIQIGLIAIVSVVVFLAMSKKWTHLLVVVSAFVLTFGVFLSFLSTNGWLEQTTFDVLVFPKSYVQNYSLSTFPKTSAMTSILALLGTWFALRHANKGWLVRLGKYLVTIYVGVMLLISVYGGYQQLLIKDRVLIGLFLALYGWSLVELFISHQNQITAKKDRVFVGLLSVASMSQLIPLFGIFHLWWGGVLGLVPISIAISRYLAKANRVSKLGFLLPVVILVIQLGIPAVKSSITDSAPLPSEQAKWINLTVERSTDELTFQSFLQEVNPNRSPILNICPNSDPFFDSAYKSSSRFHVYWDTPQFKEMFLKDAPDAGMGLHCFVQGSPRPPFETTLLSQFQVELLTPQVNSWGLTWVAFKFSKSSNEKDLK